MPIHIGKEIKKIFDKKGMTVSEFGRRIHKSRENVYSIFKRKTIDTGLLLVISSVLGNDLFKYYSEQNTNEKEIARLKKENRLLKEINSLLKGKNKK